MYSDMSSDKAVWSFWGILPRIEHLAHIPSYYLELINSVASLTCILYKHKSFDSLIFDIYFRCLIQGGLWGYLILLMVECINTDFLTSRSLINLV